MKCYQFSLNTALQYQHTPVIHSTVNAQREKGVGVTPETANTYRPTLTEFLLTYKW